MSFTKLNYFRREVFRDIDFYIIIFLKTTKKL